MDCSLWLLIRLRLVALLRRWGRSLQSLKGLLLAVVGSLVFLPSLVSVVLSPRVQTEVQLLAARRYGPLLLFAYCVLNVVLSSGDRAVYYSPAEVDHLFSGPYRPRQLLLYKVMGGVGTALLTTFFMALAFRLHARLFFSAYVALFFAMELLYLFSLAVGLAVTTFGSLAFDRARKLLILAVTVLVGVAVWPIGRAVVNLTPQEILERAVDSPTVNAILVPFRPFVLAFTSERVWPDLAAWSAVSALVDLGLLGLVLTLNGQFLEASAAASARVYARLQKAKHGGVYADAVSARIEIPTFPWWGGAGPNFWRQVTTASRTPSRLLALLFLYFMPVAVIAFTARSSNAPIEVVGPSLTIWVGIALFGPSMVNYDFRPDLNRLEDLKTLPIRPYFLALGQVLTPVLALTLASWVVLGCAGLVFREHSAMILAVAALAVPFNLILVAIENLYFLWFPFRVVGTNSLDFQAMGRQLLLLVAKGLSLGVAAALAGGAGAFVYYVLGRDRAATVVSAWFVATGCGLGLIPLVAQAFESYDVAAPPPE